MNSKVENKFYYPNGDKIENKKEFIEFYSKCYYLNNSKFVEEEIEKLLNNISKPEDVLNILAWKMGAIDWKKSQANGEIKYTNAVNADDFKIKTRQGEIEVKDICNFICQNYYKLKKELAKNILNSFLELGEDATKGLGTVYLITLIYFITGEKYPIYDRFAKLAVDAIKTGAKPGEKIKYNDLPNKSNENVLEKYKDDYINILEGIFSKEYTTNRDIDRALWVYGHLFDDRK